MANEDQLYNMPLSHRDIALLHAVVLNMHPSTASEGSGKAMERLVLRTPLWRIADLSLRLLQAHTHFHSHEPEYVETANRAIDQLRQMIAHNQGLREQGVDDTWE